MWSGARDEASAAREQGEMAKESSKTLGCEILDFILQPVAGGKLFQLLYSSLWREASFFNCSTTCSRSGSSDFSPLLFIRLHPVRI
eukprot:1138934-Rhodomonas_salina.4